MKRVTLRTKYLFLCSFLFSIYLNVFSQEQNPLLDSLQIYMQRHHAAKIRHFASLLLVENSDSSMRVEGYKYLGVADYLQSDYDNSISNYNRSLELSRQLNDSLNMAKNLINLATAYNRKGDFEKAVENAFAASVIFEKLDDKSGLARGQNLLGIFHFYRKDYAKALDYFEKYNDLAVEAKDTGEIISSFNNMSSAHHKLGNLNEERALLQKVISLYEIQQQEERAGSTYENLGGMYLDLDSLQQAESYFEKALKSYEINGEKLSIARLYVNWAKLERRREQLPLARQYLEEALKLSREGGFLSVQQEILNELTNFYVSRGDYQSALDAFQTMEQIKDSILNEKNQESINELQVQFETEKKERQIAEQNLQIAQKDQENQQKSFYIILLVSLIIILVLVTVIVMIRMRNRQERELALERMKIKQNQLKVVIESQESERKRFAQDLHDGFGQLITALKLNIKQASLNREKFDAQKTESILIEMHRQIREIAHNLMPESLLEEGLIVAVGEYVDRITRQTGIDFNIHVFGIDSDLEQQVKISTYRVIQEWINNVIKHANASSLTLQFTGYANEINIIIEDNGDGFDTQELARGEGWGWKNILSRLESINGRMEIDSMPGKKGTSLIMDIPYYTI